MIAVINYKELVTEDRFFARALEGEDEFAYTSKDKKIYDDLTADGTLLLKTVSVQQRLTEMRNQVISQGVELDDDELRELDLLAGLDSIDLQELREKEKIWQEKYSEVQERIEDTDNYDLIKVLRTEHRYTWRAVAEIVSLQIGAGWRQDQMIGMMCCKIAADHFGENFLKDPWN